ncbi:MAG: hypothetical protein ACE5DM_04310 [Candidatus Nanoarchaeia archaeon]
MYLFRRVLRIARKRDHTMQWLDLNQEGIEAASEERPLFDQKTYDEFVINNRAGSALQILPEPEQHPHGRESYVRTDWNEVVRDDDALDELVQQILTFTEQYSLDPDSFYAVPGYVNNKIVRKANAELRNRGRPSYRGGDEDLPRVVVLDGVTRNGHISLATIGLLKLVHDSKLVAIVSLLNRNEMTPLSIDSDEQRQKFAEAYSFATGKNWKGGETVPEAIQATGITYCALGNALRLIPRVIRTIDPPEHVVEAIRSEYALYGIHPINI